jgi:hypothetical protein
MLSASAGFNPRWGCLVCALTQFASSCNNVTEAARTGYTSSVKGDDTTARRFFMFSGDDR